ncbi:c5e91163-827b-4479-a9e3-2b4efa627b37-CDS [Sclerotinia trifoliorum]|uniref:C5e91163-827b-4479-a9e3-2b4efa627b37-CDS n=1 Tax=Sclerotinia trifoliorum TaxID=28548 RepID=A0A8H2W5C5_9HELO|nr:c5e91163-827b-4479-a9e3-2b4efa627b37-CDS [Sclerotinia trifoliorum]
MRPPISYAVRAKCMPSIRMLLANDSMLGECESPVFTMRIEPYEDMDILKIVSAGVVNRRQRLYELAMSACQEMQIDIPSYLENSKILDAFAWKVTRLLLDHGVSVQPALLPCLVMASWSIYHAEYLSREAAEYLYQAGFKNINERLIYHKLCSNYIHTRSCGSDFVPHILALRRFVVEEVHDNCTCTCSTGGCLLVTRMMNLQRKVEFRLDKEGNRRINFDYGWETACEMSVFWTMRPRIIQSQEMFRAFEGSLSIFLKTKWKPRMDKYLAQNDKKMDEESLQKIREIGVITE